MTFKAVFPDFWPGTDQDMGVLWASEAVSGCNILILPIYASVLRLSSAGSLMPANERLSPERTPVNLASARDF
jgi:hypothetical protein